MGGCRLAGVLVAVIAIVPPAFAQKPAVAQKNVAVQLQDVDKLLSSGDVAGAAAALQKIVAASPSLFEARLPLGRVLDLEGRHADARMQLEQALRLASDDEQRSEALVALGISYAFESKADEAARYFQRAFDADIKADERGAAAGRANALGRIYLESGNVQKAEEWYKTGYETAKQIPGLPAPQAALWEMRWHNAMGRIAARKGQRDAALKHAAEAKSLLDRGGNENQAVFYPYLLGYIAFFSKDYKGAVDELLKGDQQDPFVLGLIAQSYQKLGDKTRAEEYFRKVMAIPVPSINSAFARPLARAFLR